MSKLSPAVHCQSFECFDKTVAEIKLKSPFLLCHEQEEFFQAGQPFKPDILLPDQPESRKMSEGGQRTVPGARDKSEW